MRTLVLVDGEHYPPVTRWAIDTARARGHDVVAALLVGGTEKLALSETPDLGVPVHAGAPDRSGSLRAAIRDLAIEMVLDLSDEPVMGYRERMEAIAVALDAGVGYAGADFRMDPPTRAPSPDGVPTLAVIGTGKRTGKTAIAGEMARSAARHGLRPVVVAMGRGGPPEPQVAEAGTVTVESLVSLVAAGHHAASDYLEDALTTGVTTIGARRAGGGLAGAPFASNVAEAVALAAARRPGLLVLEGSGAAIPPIDWDAAALVVPATCPPEYLSGYLGPYRLLRSDVAIVTMARSPEAGAETLSTLTSYLRHAFGDARYVVTDFHPEPLADVRGSDVFFATTASEAVAEAQVAYLQAAHGCRVVGWSANLADRAALARDLDAAGGYEVFLTELKAAAVDTGVQRALAGGAEVVFVDNRADVVGGDVDLETVSGELERLAIQRGRNR